MSQSGWPCAYSSSAHVPAWEEQQSTLAECMYTRVRVQFTNVFKSLARQSLDLMDLSRACGPAALLMDGAVYRSGIQFYTPFEGPRTSWSCNCLDKVRLKEVDLDVPSSQCGLACSLDIFLEIQFPPACSRIEALGFSMIAFALFGPGLGNAASTSWKLHKSANSESHLVHRRSTLYPYTNGPYSYSQHRTLQALTIDRTFAFYSKFADIFLPSQTA